MTSESEYLAPAVLFEKGEVATHIISSNVKELVEEHEYVFDTLWSKAISAEQRVKEIEEGIAPIKTRWFNAYGEFLKNTPKMTEYWYDTYWKPWLNLAPQRQDSDKGRVKIE
jgi:hypothetical protein